MQGEVTDAVRRRRSARSSPVPRRPPRLRTEVHEPCPPDFVEWGGELIFVVDWTAGGAPIGPRIEEIEEMFGDPGDRPEPPTLPYDDCPY
jgi:hypothetical protein